MHARKAPRPNRHSPTVLVCGQPQTFNIRCQMRSSRIVGFFLLLPSLLATAMPPIPLTQEQEACQKSENPEACQAKLLEKSRAAARSFCESRYGNNKCDEFESAETEGQLLLQRVGELYSELMQSSNEYYKKELEASQRNWANYSVTECQSRARLLVKGDDSFLLMYFLNTCMNEQRKSRVSELGLHFCERSEKCKQSLRQDHP